MKLLLALLFAVAAIANDPLKPPGSFWFAYCENRDGWSYDGQCRGGSYVVVPSYCVYLDTNYVHSWGYAELCTLVELGGAQANSIPNKRKREVLQPKSLEEGSDVSVLTRKNRTVSKRTTTYLTLSTTLATTTLLTSRITYYYSSTLIPYTYITYKSVTTTQYPGLSSINSLKVRKYIVSRNDLNFNILTATDVLIRYVSSSSSWYNKINLGLMWTAFIPYYRYLRVLGDPHTDCCADTGLTHAHCLIPDSLSSYAAPNADSKVLLVYNAFLASPFTNNVMMSMYEPYILRSASIRSSYHYTTSYPLRTAARMKSLYTWARYTSLNANTYLNSKYAYTISGSFGKREEKEAELKRNEDWAKRKEVALKKRGLSKRDKELILATNYVYYPIYVPKTHFRVHPQFGGKVPLNSNNGKTMCEEFYYGYNTLAVPTWFNSLYIHNVVLFESWYNGVYLRTGTSARPNLLRRGYVWYQGF